METKTIYGCTLDKIKTKDLVSFYEDRHPQFSKSGMNTFCKNIKVPTNYFNKQSLEFQKEILVEEKNRMLSEDMTDIMFLKDPKNEKYDFFKTETDRMSVIDPFAELGFS